MGKKPFKNLVQISRGMSQGYLSGGRNLIRWGRGRLLRVHQSNVKELQFFYLFLQIFLFLVRPKFIVKKTGKQGLYMQKEHNQETKQNKHTKNKTIAIKIKKNIYTKKEKKIFLLLQ